MSQVALRIRPLKNEEIARGYQAVATKVDSKMVLLSSIQAGRADHLREKRSQERQYVFDVVFGSDSTQEASGAERKNWLNLQATIF